MEFITDNYIWFLVAGIIILMAIIGYIAEKTDFGRKTKTKKERPGKEKTAPISESVAEPVTNAFTDFNTVVDPVVSVDVPDLDPTFQISPDQEMNNPYPESSPQVDPALFAPLGDTEVSSSVEEVVNETEEPASEPISEPLAEPVSESVEETVSEPVEEKEDLTLPDISSLTGAKEKKPKIAPLPDIDEEDDDDIWKF